MTRWPNGYAMHEVNRSGMFQVTYKFMVVFGGTCGATWDEAAQFIRKATNADAVRT